jgi:hypothetical protein
MCARNVTGRIGAVRKNANVNAVSALQVDAFIAKGGSLPKTISIACSGHRGTKGGHYVGAIYFRGISRHSFGEKKVVITACWDWCGGITSLIESKCYGRLVAICNSLV